MGLGFVRSTFDILAAPGLLRQAAIVHAGIFGALTGVALRYWFPAPLFFLAAAFLCFVAAVATAPRTAA